MGVDTAVRQLAIAQCRAGADVHLLVNGTWPVEDVRTAGVVVHEVGLNGARRLLRALAGRPTVLHDHVVWSPTTMLPLLAGRLPNMRSVVSAHGCLAADAWASGRWKKLTAWHAIFKHAVRAHQAVVATSEPERVDISACCPRMPVVLIPNTQVAPAGYPCEAAGGARTVGFIGRLHPVKGVLELLQAWRQIVGEHPDWRLRLVGPAIDRDYADRVRALAATLPSVSVEDALYGADKWQFLTACDLIAVPSRTENFCLVVAESYLAGTPVMTTFGVPWPELQELKMGWRTAGDPASLAAMLRTAIATDGKERAAMGRRGAAFVAARFDQGTVARRSFEVYDGLW